jgi:16S rRNA (adenine1518-N6/adenine1519-N6)-dimethyltransferase
MGQHFLLNPRGALMFLEGLASLEASVALEVGPGAGSITFAAAEALDRIVAVEIDARLAEALSARVPPNVAVVRGDGVAAARSFPVSHVYSNTPFNLSSEIVEAVARNNAVAGAVLGVQREVALRMSARPGTSNYGRLSVLSQLVFEVKLAGVIPPSWYYPRPEVYTAVVVLRRKRKWGPRVERTLELAACMFTMRRKLASKALQACFAKLGCSGDPPRGWEGVRVWEVPPESLEEAAESCVK